nr:serine/threonine-protein phosphatase 6 regulatory ankyrin repeat subunit B-like [Lytechinus pictus]
MWLIKTFLSADIQPTLGVVNSGQSGHNANAINGGDTRSCNLLTSQQPDGDVDDMMSISPKANDGNTISKEECIIENQVALPSVTLQQSDDLKCDFLEKNEFLTPIFQIGSFNPFIDFSCNLSPLQRPNRDVDDMSQDIEFEIIKDLEQIHFPSDVIKRLLNLGIDQSDEEGYTSLYKAASRGHLLKVIDLGESGADPNKANEDGRTALHVAAEKGHVDILRYLVYRGADMNAECDLGQTPLHVAINSSQYRSQRFLTSNGADVHKRDNYGRTPLHMAAAAGNIHIFKHLVDKTCDINVEDAMGLTVLHHAVRNGHSNIVNYLLEKGAEETPYGGDSLLFASASFGNLDLVKLFISRGGDVNEENGIGQNPLHLAASKGYFDITKCLVEEGCDMNKEDHEDFIPVHEAVLNGHLDVLDYLITQQAKITKHLAAIHGHLDILRYFIEMGADVSELDDSGQTPLHVAASKGYLDITKCLIEEGCGMNDEDHEDFTPVHGAVLNGHLDVLDYLIMQQAKITKYNGKGVLHLAAIHGHLDILRYFIKMGADVSELDDGGQSPLHVAAGMGHLDIVKYLTEQGSTTDKQDHSGYTLHIAAAKGQLRIVKYLIDQNCSKKEFDNAGLTPMALAAKHGHLDTLKYLADGNCDETDSVCKEAVSGLLDNGIYFMNRISLHQPASHDGLDNLQSLVQQGFDINSCDEKGWTPLDYAIQNHKCEVIDYLLTNGAKANQGRDESPLYMPSKLSPWEAVHVLFLRGIKSVNAESHRGQIPLHAAAATGRIQVVETLIQNGSNLNKTDIDGMTPLHAAVQNGHLEVLKYLKWKGAIDLKYRGMTYLYMAAQSGHLDTVDYFLSNGSDVNEKNDTGHIPLHAAAANGSLEIVEKLINHGSNVNKMADDGSTPLHAAAHSGRSDVVQYLISNGAIKTRFEGMTVLYIAAQRGHIDLIEYFATTGCGVDDGITCDKTPLLAAIYNGDMDSVEMLVTQGAYINQADRNKWTPLHAAAQEGHLRVVTYLVDNGADTNAKDTDGITPLQAAEDGGHEDVKQFLIRFKAEVQDERLNETEKTDGMTPIQAAEDAGQEDGQQCLIRITVKVHDEWHYETEKGDRRTPLLVADVAGYEDGQQCLIRESCIAKPKTQLPGGEEPATDDLPVTSMTNENDAVDPKLGIKNERRINENCFSTLALVHRAILALAFFFACCPIIVAGNLRLTEPVTLEAGTRGVVTFYLERPSSTLQFSPFFTIQFGSKGRPFCINGRYDAAGFKDPSQVSRFTITVINRDTCVNMTIDDVDTVDEDQYIFMAVWHSGENVLHDTQNKLVSVQRPPGPADCFITLSDSEYPYEVHCWAKTGSMPTRLTCYQNDRNLVKVHNITENMHTTRGIFFLPDTTHFSCCSHDITSTVDAANCNDFEWPPGYSGILSTETTTSRSRSASEQPNMPADATGVTYAESHVGSGARRSLMIPSQRHFLYLFVYIHAFVIMC